MAINYAYKYAVLSDDPAYYGMCVEVQDTSNYILRPDYIPIEDDTVNYFLKYYHPIPESVTSFADFNGLFYYDSEHTQPFDEGNAALRHED